MSLRRIPLLLALTLSLGPRTANAQCWDVCLGGGSNLDLRTEARTFALAGAVALAAAGLGVSVVHLGELSAPPTRGALAAGGVSAAMNLTLGGTFLALPCEQDQCAFHRGLAAVNLSFGVLNLLTTALVANLAPETTVRPFAGFDGRRAQVGLAVQTW